MPRRVNDKEVKEMAAFAVPFLQEEIEGKSPFPDDMTNSLRTDPLIWGSQRSAGPCVIGKSALNREII